MEQPIESRYCGFEITFERNPDADGIVARAVHPSGTVFSCNHSKSVRGARQNILKVIRSSEFHPEHSLRRAWPQPLLKLYKQALLFLDNQSAVHDRYWAAGIVRALDKSFPVLPEVADGNQVRRSAIERPQNKTKPKYKPGSQQLVLDLADEQRPERCGLVDQRDEATFHRRRRTAASIEVGRRVVLICTIWSTPNRVTIERGTWGAIAEVSSRIKVEWELPYYQSRLSDCFASDEYLDYFEEE